MLRELEQQANEVFDAYRQLYYGKDDDNDAADGRDNVSSVSSVYLWNKEGGTIQEGFAGSFLIQKDIVEFEEGEGSQSGYWNSIHVVDVNVLSGGKAKYEVSTTVLVSIDLKVPLASTSSGSGSNHIKIGGSLSKQAERILPFQSTVHHISNIGHIIEDSENELRSNMDKLYIQKTKEVMDRIRTDAGVEKKHGLLAAMMMSGGSRGGGGSGGADGELQNEMQAALKARFNRS